MKLKYRGIEYEYDPTQGRTIPVDRVWQSHEPMMLTYRGNRYQLDPNRPARSISEERPRELMYRGNRYWTGAPDGKPMLGKSRQVQNLALTHRENLQRNLQRRIEIARQKGDNALLALLEAERRQIV